jgi:hypothetical protein
VNRNFYLIALAIFHHAFVVAVASRAGFSNNFISIFSQFFGQAVNCFFAVNRNMAKWVSPIEAACLSGLEEMSGLCINSIRVSAPLHDKKYDENFFLGLTYFSLHDMPK